MSLQQQQTADISQLTSPFFVQGFPGVPHELFPESHTKSLALHMRLILLRREIT